MRLRTPFARTIEQLNRSRLFTYIAALLAVGPPLVIASQLADFLPTQIAQLLAVALLLPLFPLHGIYVAAVTRTPRPLSPALAVLLPALGAYWLANLSSNLPVGLLGVVKWLALLGAIYGSLKALAQVRVTELVAYSSLAAFSALWWGFAMIGHFRMAGFFYVAAVTLLTAGFLLAAQFFKKRYGDLELDQFHGLARRMPRFAALFSLFVMAAVGLPPFALFSAHMNLVLEATAAVSRGIGVILLTWFLASWYLVRMMQRLLFGRHREDMHYTDLRTGELTWLAILLAILAALGVTPPAWFETHPPNDSHRTAMETRLWHK